MATTLGLFSDRMIRRLIRDGCIKGARVRNVGPASLGLGISSRIFRVPHFSRVEGASMDDMIDTVDGAVRCDLADPLERGEIHAAKFCETFALSPGVAAIATGKTSLARNDVHVRIVAANVASYEALPHGFLGELWAFVRSRSFAVQLVEGETIAQLCFFCERVFLSRPDVVQVFEYEPLLWSQSSYPLSAAECTLEQDGAIVLSVDLHGEMVGWEARITDDVFQLKGKRRYAPFRFFRPVSRDDRGDVIVRKGRTYLFGSKERLRLPPSLAGCLRATDAGYGDFSACDANLINPGWGWGERGEGCGRPIVFEIRPREDFLLSDGQYVISLKLEWMAEPPRRSYDQRRRSFYRHDAPTRDDAPTRLLSRHFISE